MRGDTRTRTYAGAVRAAVLLIAVACVLFVPCVCAAHASQQEPDPFAQGVSSDLADGTYLADVALEGGTGRASVSSPAEMQIRDSRLAVTLVWSSPHYDYMDVADARYLPCNEGGNSTFVIPFLALDQPFSVVADTTAMSQPHEITYQITLDSSSIRAQDARNASHAWVVVAAVTVACAVVVLVVLRIRRRETRSPHSGA